MKDVQQERVCTRVMELKDLIAGPLVATIDADSLSARHYLDYLFKIAFETYDPETGRLGELRMLTFSYIRHDLAGSHLQSVSIPLLTLVPLPLLQVHEADFDFDIHILDAYSRQQQESFSFKTGTSEPGRNVQEGNDTRFRVALAASPGGNAGPQGNMRSSLNANMKIHVRMRQADIPGGLSMLLNKAVNDMASEVSLDTESRQTND